MSQSQSFAAPRRQDTGGSSSAGVASVSAVSAPAPAPPAVSASAAAPASGSTSSHLDSASPGGHRQYEYEYHHQQQQQPDELHMPGMTGSPQRQHLQNPESYAPPANLNLPGNLPGNPQIKLDHSPALASANPSSVPNVLQPGGLTARPQPVSANAAPALPTAQSSLSPQDSNSSAAPLHQDYIRPTLNMSHTYSRSSPAGSYDTPGGYTPYTPSTPGGVTSSQFMSPSDASKYGQPGSQRHISNTPLGLADIRPRADSSMSDGGPGTMGYDLAHAQAGTSNYMAPWPIYAFDWCKWRPQANGAGKLAVGSYLEDGHNFIQILDSHTTTTPSDIYTHGTSKYTLEFSKVAEATHSYPVTRLLWEPPSSQKQSTDLLATSGDHLRLWSLPSETPSTPGSNINRRGADAPGTKLTPLALLSNSKTPDHTAPLTSLDWNTKNPALIITSSIDTTCTIWDIPSLTAKTQLIAHDKEVYDVRFCANSVDVFVSCGQDGSVRMFDLRSLEHSTIIYEPTGKDDRVDTPSRASPNASQQSAGSPPPLLRLATSPHDTHLLATFAQDSGTIRILDARQPGQALLELRGHSGAVNSLDWSPLRRGLLASGGDDCQVLLWDLMNASSGSTGANGSQESERSPVATWECEYEVANLAWAPHLQAGEQGEWLGVSGGRGVWGTRVS